MRILAKRVTESLICGLRLPRIVRARRRWDVLILAYHNVVPHGEPVRGDASLHLRQRSFARQLDLLGRTHEVVPLDEAFAEPAGRRRPRAVITFDDAYRGAVTAGVEELARRGLPATIFVVPAFVGGRCFWWDVLAAVEGSLSPERRRHGVEALRGVDSDVRRWTGHDSDSAVPLHQGAATEDLLRAAEAHSGISLASHTWSHPNLQRMSPPELEQELTRPLGWLRIRFQRVIPWLSYPYGLSSPGVERAAVRAGYVGAVAIEGGWLRAEASADRRFTQPRLNVPAGVSLRGFELRTSGLLAG